MFWGVSRNVVEAWVTSQPLIPRGEQFGWLRHIAATESVSLRAPLSATGAAAHLREEFPHFCTGSVGKKVLLKTPPVAE